MGHRRARSECFQCSDFGGAKLGLSESGVGGVKLSLSEPGVGGVKLGLSESGVWARSWHRTRLCGVGWSPGFLLLLFTLIFPACQKAHVPPISQSPQVHPTPAPSRPHVATRWEPDGPDTAFPMARLDGTLAEENDCLVLRPGGISSSYTLLWPHGTQFVRDQKRVDLPQAGQPRCFELGSRLRITGGEIPSQHARKLARVGDCVGPYWFVARVE